MEQEFYLSDIFTITAPCPQGKNAGSGCGRSLLGWIVGKDRLKWYFVYVKSN